MVRGNGFGTGTRLKMKWAVWKTMMRFRIRKLFRKNDKPPYIY